MPLSRPPEPCPTLARMVPERASRSWSGPTTPARPVAVTTIAFRYVLKRPNPLLAERFNLPTKSDIDARLIGGSAIYGVGWGLVGFCVGPSIAALAYGDNRVVIFVVALIAGAWIANIVTRAKPTPLLADG